MDYKLPQTIPFQYGLGVKLSPQVLLCILPSFLLIHTCPHHPTHSVCPLCVVKSRDLWNNFHYSWVGYAKPVIDTPSL